MLVDTYDRNVRETFASKAKSRLEDLRHMFRSSAVDYVEIRTDADYMQPLIRFFRIRERRI